MVIFKVNNFILWNLGELVLEKMEISEYVFGKNHGKLAHLRNLSPKIIYAYSLSPNRITILLSYKRRCWGLIPKRSIITVKLCLFHIPSLPKKFATTLWVLSQNCPFLPFFSIISLCHLPREKCERIKIRGRKFGAWWRGSRTRFEEQSLISL